MAAFIRMVWASCECLPLSHLVDELWEARRWGLLNVERKVSFTRALPFLQRDIVVQQRALTKLVVTGRYLYKRQSDM